MNRHLLRTMLCTLVVLSLFSSCRKEGNHPANYPEGCPNYTDGHNYAGDMISAMSPGIYVFRTSDDFGECLLLAKGTDGSAFYLDNINNLGGNFVGNWLYYHFYATDNDRSAYTLLAERFENEDRAYYYKQDEFLDRADMFKGIKDLTAATTIDDTENFAMKVAEMVYKYPLALCRYAPHYDSFLDEWEPSFDTLVCGIPVTCYHRDGYYYYVDKDWMCLYKVNKHMLNSVTGETEFELVRYEEAGNFEETYHKIYEMYGVTQPAPTLGSCLKWYRKQANEWLTDEYPRSLDHWFDRYTGQGTIHDMEIIRRAAWETNFDFVSEIIVKITDASYEDVVAFKELEKTHCDAISYDDFDPSTGTVHFAGSFENVDTSGLGPGDSYYHPGYEIILNEEGVLSITFDVIKTTII